MTTLTIEHIAELANTSRSTVSRVINNQPNVRPAVRERVLQIMREQGYAPRAAAQNLARQRTRAIGLLIPATDADNLADPFFGSVIQSVSEATTRVGYFVMLSVLTTDMEHGFYERVLRSRHFDGVIMLADEIDNPILPLLMRDGTPLVLLGSHPYLQNLTFVDVRQREGANRAVSHLIGLGHQRIATITGPLQQAASLERRDGYKQSLLEAGLPILSEFIVEGDWTLQGGYNAMARLLSLPQPPTAVFVASDTMAIGAMRAIHTSGRHVPSDIALVSFDDLPAARYTTPTLSTIRQPLPDIGTTAVSLLIDQVERGVRRGEHVYLTGELVVRESCGAALRAAEPLVVRREEVQQGLTTSAP